jgi:uncharacterized protein (TIGR02118 family)
MYKVVTLIKRRPGLPVEDFQTRWHRVHGPLVAAGPGVRRYVQSHALLQGHAKGELIFDGIAEAWFDPAEAHEAFERSSAATAIAAVEEELLDGSRTVVMPVDGIGTASFLQTFRRRPRPSSRGPGTRASSDARERS